LASLGERNTTTGDEKSVDSFEEPIELLLREVVLYRDDSGTTGPEVFDVGGRDVGVVGWGVFWGIV